MRAALPFTAADLLPGALQGLTPLLDAVTGLATLQQLYGAAPRTGSFLDVALATLGIAVNVEDDGLARVPATGPLVVAANHPHGAADGLAVAAAIRRVRADVKLLASDLVHRIPEMREHLVAVDAFRQGQGRNGAAVRQAVDWVRDGHVLVVFPAGEVSHVRAARGRVVDGPWREGIAHIAARADAPVLPMAIAGRNSGLFLAAGRVHPLIRTALLPRELLRMRGRTLHLRIGRVVSARRLEAFGEPAVRTAYLRARCESLLSPVPQRHGRMRLWRRAGPAAPVAPETPVHLVEGDIASLPASARLLESGAWEVYCAAAADVPHVLDEIGRLREMTFRDAGEGTGAARDLDRFDRDYHHLFVWHRERRIVAGAYRLAFADRLVGRRGLSALYTRTLFRYRRRLLDEIGPALELGRSFVRPECQRDYQPLLLLWRGVGRVVAREPRYRVLFGPVSISAEYGATTRQILARFLMASRYSAALGALVRPKRPLAADPHDQADVLVRSTIAASLDEVDGIVRDLEADGRGMPVLLRQYLKLNARLLGFSVDPAFGHVLDGLVVVDLLDVDRALLARYLGKDGAARFLEFHRSRGSAAARLVYAGGTA